MAKRVNMILASSIDSEIIARVIDKRIDQKLLISVAPDGYQRRVS